MSDTRLNYTNEAILAVFAHADDLEICVGGTLLKYHDLGYEVVYVMTTNNFSGSAATLHPDGTRTNRKMNPPDLEKLRKSECAAAAEVLGTTPIHLDYAQRHFWTEDGTYYELAYGMEVPEGVPTNVPTIVTAGEDKEGISRLADLIIEKNPEVVLTHSCITYNVEHWTSAQLTVKAFWQAVERGYRGACLQVREPYTLYGEFNCRWETYIDFSEHVERKMELIGKHACQMPNAHLPDFGHRDVAASWGRANNCKGAECYTWVRHPDFRLKGVGSPTYPPLLLELLNNNK